MVCVGIGSCWSHLKSALGCWNNQLVRHLFVKNDSDLILSIPLSYSSSDDSLVWQYTNDGEYTVQSGSNLGMSQLVTDFSARTEANAVIPVQRRLIAAKNIRWQPPAGLLYKINMDASISVENGCVGVGIVICNHCGLVMRKIQFVSRKANLVAHSLSKFALSVVRNCFWVEEFPPYVGNQVLRDLPM
ncbi:hypothetical protein QYF36_026987 [Acer negundo]|nr:hypothetical protein QYF36_026987 [Acer negundo]